MFNFVFFFFFKQKTSYEMRISDWSSDVCSSDLIEAHKRRTLHDPFSHIIGAICRRIRYQLPRAYRAALPSSNARVEQSARLPYAILPQHGDAPRMTAPIALVDDHRNNLTRSEEHTSELQSLMRTSNAVFSL